MAALLSISCLWGCRRGGGGVSVLLLRLALLLSLLGCGGGLLGSLLLQLGAVPLQAVQALLQAGGGVLVEVELGVLGHGLEFAAIFVGEAVQILRLRTIILHVAAQGACVAAWVGVPPLNQRGSQTFGRGCAACP